MTRNLFIFSGAGLSAESGLATFRGSASSLWENEDLSVVCDYGTWKANRERVFSFYNARKQDVAAATPNEAHRWIAEWQSTWGADRVQVMTQNVDDLLERAGATAVTHLHGELTTAHCTACGTRWQVAGAFDVEGRCPKCNSLKGVKPGVVFFHEPAPRYRDLAQWFKRIRPQDILLVIGTAFEVLPVVMVVPLHKAGEDLTWQVNPHPAAPEWFGRNLAHPASVGCAVIAPWLAQLMEDGRTA